MVKGHVLNEKNTGVKCMNWSDWVKKNKGFLLRVQSYLNLTDYQMNWLMGWGGFIKGILVGMLLWIIFG